MPGYDSKPAPVWAHILTSTHTRIRAHFPFPKVEPYVPTQLSTGSLCANVFHIFRLGIKSLNTSPFCASALSYEYLDTKCEHCLLLYINTLTLNFSELDKTNWAIPNNCFLIILIIYFIFNVFFFSIYWLGDTKCWRQNVYYYKVNNFLVLKSFPNCHLVSLAGAELGEGCTGYEGCPLRWPAAF